MLKARFLLHEVRGKHYTGGVPVCPKCSSVFHPGAEKQCPCCGYSLLTANRVFGDKVMDFPRVCDEAGALTHKERMALAKYLEKTERRIPPIALCVYVTDHGSLPDFRSHAHWLINHAKIRHETFGKRGRRRALEDAVISVRDPRVPREEEKGGLWARFAEWREDVVEMWRDMAHPVPPEARLEWMLALVIDVQLELACFSWGYMLDPYIDPDRITTPLIKKSKTLFRERETLKAIETVMNSAACHIAKRAHAMKKRSLWSGMGMALAGIVGLMDTASAVSVKDLPDLASAPPSATVSQVEEVREEAATEAVKSSVPLEANKETDDFPAEWVPSDQKLLLEGVWWQNYPGLFPGKGEEHPALIKVPADLPAASREDEGIPEAAISRYARPESSGLIDPQGFMTEPQRDDIKHLLNILHSRCPFRIYVALFGKEQQEPTSLSPQRLILQIGRAYERSVLLHYHLGAPESLQIAYDPAFLKELTDSERSKWLSAVQGAAESFSRGEDALHASLTTLAEKMQPVVDQLPPRELPNVYSLESLETANLPQRSVSLVNLSQPQQTETKKRDWRMALSGLPENPMFQPVAIGCGTIAVILGGLISWLVMRRRCAKLNESEADVRLSSVSGAGVSRAVRYMEGKETPGGAKKVL